MNYAERLSEIQRRGLPDAVSMQAKRCLKDVLGVAAGAAALADSRRLFSITHTQFGSGRATLWFRGAGSSLLGASYHNAMLVDFLDGHDGYRPAKGHAGATVIPVVLACAGEDTRGCDLLTAIALGYEVACRGSVAVHSLYGPTYHASGSWAALGAAVAGALVQGIPAESLDAVVGAAEYYAPMAPMMRCVARPGPVKDAAGGGALAAALALGMYKNGLHGLPSLFVSEQCAREQMATLGEEWLILRQYFKRYPTCRWTHPAVEGALQLQLEHGFAPEGIEAIEVETFKAAGEAICFPPCDTHQAQYSLPWALAVALIDGDIGAEQVGEHRLTEQRVLALGRRVRIQANDDLEARFPEECLARVRILLRDGRRLIGQTRSARGDPDAPLSEKELDTKFRTYAALTMSPERVRALSDVLASLERRGAADMMALLESSG